MLRATSNGAQSSAPTVLYKPSCGKSTELPYFGEYIFVCVMRRKARASAHLVLLT